MEMIKGKVFQKPDAGLFYGTICDVVDMQNYPTPYGPQNKVRILWVLNRQDNTPALDNEGKYLTIAEFHNAKTAETGNLMKACRQILNGPVPLINSTEELAQLLIGRSCSLFLVKSPNMKNPADPYTNIQGHAPLSPGQVPPRIPADFVREVNKPKFVAGQATYATPQAAYATQQGQVPAPQQPPPPYVPASAPAPAYPPQPGTTAPAPQAAPKFCQGCGGVLPNHSPGCSVVQPLTNNVNLNPPGQPQQQRPF